MTSSTVWFRTGPSIIVQGLIGLARRSAIRNKRAFAGKKSVLRKRNPKKTRRTPGARYPTFYLQIRKPPPSFYVILYNAVEA